MTLREDVDGPWVKTWTCGPRTVDDCCLALLDVRIVPPGTRASFELSHLEVDRTSRHHSLRDCEHIHRLFLEYPPCGILSSYFLENSPASRMKKNAPPGYAGAYEVVSEWAKVRRAYEERAGGKEISKVQPPSGLLCTVISPAWRSITALANESPKPVPSRSLVRAFSAR